MFANVSFDFIRLGVLSALLTWVCVTDVRARRIPNSAVVIIALTGFLSAIVHPSPFSGVAQACVHALAGMATGFGLWFVLYLFRMIGAGDVKLFAACAVWLGPLGAVDAAIWSALAGGLMALIAMSVEHGVRITAVRMSVALQAPSTLRDRQPTRFNRLPYGIAMAIGVLIALQFPDFMS